MKYIERESLVNEAFGRVSGLIVEEFLSSGLDGESVASLLLSIVERVDGVREGMLEGWDENFPCEDREGELAVVNKGVTILAPGDGVETSEDGERFLPDFPEFRCQMDAEAGTRICAALKFSPKMARTALAMKEEKRGNHTVLFLKK